MFVCLQSEPPPEASIGVTVTALLDPLSTVAQKLAPMLELLRSALNVGIKVDTCTPVCLSANPSRQGPSTVSEAQQQIHAVNLLMLSTLCLE